MLVPFWCPFWCHFRDQSAPRVTQEPPKALQDLLRAAKSAPSGEHFGSLWGAFWEPLGSISDPIGSIGCPYVFQLEEKGTPRAVQERRKRPKCLQERSKSAPRLFAWSSTFYNEISIRTKADEEERRHQQEGTGNIKYIFHGNGN